MKRHASSETTMKLPIYMEKPSIVCRLVVTFLFFYLQTSSANAESCAVELHAALGRRDFQAASKLVHAAPHASVFEMLNAQQQNAVHLAGELSLPDSIDNPVDIFKRVNGAMWKAQSQDPQALRLADSTRLYGICTFTIAGSVPVYAKLQTLGKACRYRLQLLS